MKKKLTSKRTNLSTSRIDLKNILVCLKKISHNTNQNIFDKLLKWLPFIIGIATFFAIYQSCESIRIASSSFKNQLDSDSINDARNTLNQQRDSIKFAIIDSILTTQNKTIKNLFESSETQLMQLKAQTKYLKEQNQPNFEITNPVVRFQLNAPMRRSTPETKTSGFLFIEQNIFNKGIRPPSIFYYETYIIGTNIEKANMLLQSNEFGHGKKFIGHCSWDSMFSNSFFIAIKIIWTEFASSNNKSENYYYNVHFDSSKYRVDRIAAPGRKNFVEKMKREKISENSFFYISTEDISQK